MILSINQRNRNIRRFEIGKGAQQILNGWANTFATPYNAAMKMYNDQQLYNWANNVYQDQYDSRMANDQSISQQGIPRYGTIGIKPMGADGPDDPYQYINVPYQEADAIAKNTNPGVVYRFRRDPENVVRDPSEIAFEEDLPEAIVYGMSPETKLKRETAKISRDKHFFNYKLGLLNKYKKRTGKRLNIFDDEEFNNALMDQLQYETLKQKIKKPATKNR